jgi:hypothetical protein
MSAADEWANDAPPKHNPLRHDLVLVATVLAFTTVEWWENRRKHSDKTRWERVHAITRAVIVTACVIAGLYALTGCRGDESTPVEVPGIDQGHVPFHPEQALVDRLNNALEASR